MRIYNQLLTLNIFNHFQKNWEELNRTFERLSSGLRISRASDDPAGLAISEKLRAQVRGLNQATRNAQDGVSLINIAEGALNETHSILQRLRELAVQAANDTLTTSDRRVIQTESDILIEEIDRIANHTEFNSKKLINDNPFDGKLQIGANAGQTMNVKFNSMESDNIGVDNLNYTTQLGAEEAIHAIDGAIESVSLERSRMGALTNRLEHVMNVNTVSAENTAAAESRIRDVDLAQEAMKMTRLLLLAQVQQALMAQANQYPYMILQLLRS